MPFAALVALTSGNLMAKGGFIELEGCLVNKEWVPLEPGNIEHKYYCYGLGLLKVEGNAGGKTEWTEIVSDSRFD